MQVMDQYLAELSDYQKREAEKPDPLALEKAGHAALWLRETVKLVESSGLAKRVGSEASQADSNQHRDKETHQEQQDSRCGIGGSRKPTSRY